MAQYPTEPKVVAGTVGAGFGVAISNFILWVLGVTIWGASTDAVFNDKAIAAVPSAVSHPIDLLVPAALAFLLGWLAPHADRPQPNPVLNSPTWNQPLNVEHGVVPAEGEKHVVTFDTHPNPPVTPIQDTGEMPRFNDLMDGPIAHKPAGT